MHAIPYLNFDGKCAEAFTFYERVLGGRIERIVTHAESPIADQVPAGWGDRVLHARLVAGDLVLLASDSPPGQYTKPQGLFVSLQVSQAADAERIFHALAEHGQVILPMEKTFWAERFGMCYDRFSTPWMVNCDLPAGAGQTARKRETSRAGR